MSESLLRPPAIRDVGALADWVEATMAIENTTLFAKAGIRRRLAADGNDDEAAVSLVMSEIRRRSALGGALYPFAPEGAGVRRRPVTAPFYDFLLVCSLSDASFRPKRDWSSSVALFEQLTALALTAVFGPGTKALRFGHPPEPTRPPRFADAIRWLADQMGLQVGPGRAGVEEQDGGADAVAWRPYRDGRPGFPMLLAQCTLQQSYSLKGADIILGRWRSWITLLRDPMTALVVPFSIGHDRETWAELHFTVDVILDRFRLCELLEQAETPAWPERRRLEGWLDYELAELRLSD